MLDHFVVDQDAKHELFRPGSDVVSGSPVFWAAKRVFDIVVSLVLLFIFIPVALTLLIINPFLNRGSLFYVQQRMGRNCRPFHVIKFRSMIHVTEIVRGHDDPVEHDRITMVGRIIRKSRLDELPQILNVLKGEMSLIGPRPDFYDHASVFISTIPHYAERHTIRPGISGLAQVNLGYAEGTEATKRKVASDLSYIQNAGFRQETRLFFKTISTIVRLAGL